LVKERMPVVEDRMRDRLAQLSGRLGDAERMDGESSPRDLMTIDLLRRLK
jgi:glutathione S-transferase